MIEIGINSKILVQILDGRKVVEGRLAKGKFLTINTGDIISLREDFYADGVIVRSHNGAARIQVKGIERYGSFREMLSSVGFSIAIPDAASLDEAVDEYSFYYSRADEKESGVLGISFKVVSS